MWLAKISKIIGCLGSETQSLISDSKQYSRGGWAPTTFPAFSKGGQAGGDHGPVGRKVRLVPLYLDTFISYSRCGNIIRYRCVCLSWHWKGGQNDIVVRLN